METLLVIGTCKALPFLTPMPCLLVVSLPAHVCSLQPGTPSAIQNDCVLSVRLLALFLSFFFNFGIFWIGGYVASNYLKVLL